MSTGDRNRIRVAREILNEARQLAYPRPPKGSCGIGPRSPDVVRAALERCDEAVVLCPTLVDAYVERSSLRNEVGDDDGAKADALRALQPRPTDVRSYLRISFRFDWPERRQILQTAMRRLRGSPSDRAFLWLNVADTYWYEGRFEDQVRELRKLLRYRTRIRYFRRIDLDYSTLGAALQALGRYGEAEETYRDGLKSRHGRRLAQDVVLARVRRNDFQGAEEALQRLRPKLPRDLAGLLRAAIRGLQGKSARSSPRTLDKATQQTPFGGVGLFGFYAAVVLLRMGREAEARPLLRRYIADSEGNPREWGITNRWEIAKAKELLAAPNAGQRSKPPPSGSASAMSRW